MAFVKCVIYRKSTQQIINYNYVVNSEVFPVVLSDPDLACYVEYQPLPEPQFDARLYKLQVTSGVTENSHPDYPSMKTYEITYKEIARSKEEMANDALTEMLEANAGVYNGFRMDELQTKAIPILLKKINGNTLETWEQEILDLISNVGAKIQDNQSVYEQKKNAIDAGQIVDLEAGYIIE